MYDWYIFPFILTALNLYRNFSFHPNISMTRRFNSGTISFDRKVTTCRAGARACRVHAARARWRRRATRAGGSVRAGPRGRAALVTLADTDMGVRTQPYCHSIQSSRIWSYRKMQGNWWHKYLPGPTSQLDETTTFSCPRMAARCER